ncbi:MAG TPA: PQQ-binding-like beta-propeller repeat protein, partial [Candidatus Acidoferrum sp.]|nr:PQQ-binding-like beta-propeller repeat protein [Candidatus Acidoferrum sp.]
VYFSCWDHNFYCLNAQTGAVVWNYTTGYDDDSSPAVSGGNVYMASVSGIVYAFGGAVVPEFPSTMILSLLMVILTLAAVVATRRFPKKTKIQY